MTGVAHVAHAMALPARLLTDGYLAAFAEAAALRMVTFDKDFGRFDGLECFCLAAARH